MAKWHTDIKRQKHFDKNNLNHNRVHFSLKILQKLQVIFTFLWRHVELWTAEKGLKPRYFIRDSLICPPIFARWQPSIGYPILGPMHPSSFIYDLYGFSRFFLADVSVNQICEDTIIWALFLKYMWHRANSPLKELI